MRRRDVVRIVINRCGSFVVLVSIAASSYAVEDQVGVSDNDRYAPRDPASWTVSRRPVTRQDYVACVRPFAKGFESGPDRGQYGPRHALPAMAVFALAGDPQLGTGIKQTLRHYAAWVQQCIAKDRGVFSMEGATLCNSAAGARIFALELAARHTRDGRYRWVAHRLLNFGQARVGPAWNTQNVGERRGEHWLDTWFSGHFFQIARLYDTPPWDLLIYHAPQPGRQLECAELGDTSQGPSRLIGTRYAWEGLAEPGQRLQFVQVLLPHAPTRDASALAAGIKVLADEPGLAAVSVSHGAAHEVALLNPAGRQISFDAGPAGRIATDARCAYVDLQPNRPARGLALSATFLEHGSPTALRAKERRDVETVTPDGAQLPQRPRENGILGFPAGPAGPMRWTRST